MVLSDDYLLPGVTFSLDFAQGISNAGAPSRDVCFVMPKLSTGTATVNTTYKLKSVSHAQTLGGSGSPIHRAAIKYFDAFKRGSGDIYAFPFAATSGGSPVTAKSTYTFTTTSTASGIVYLTFVGEDFQVAVAKSQSPTTIASNVADAINTHTHFPLSASALSGTLTLAAKLPGASMGDGYGAQVRHRITITPGIGTTVAGSGNFLGSSAAGVDGSTTESSNLSAALAILATDRKYYLTIHTSTATDLAALDVQLRAKSDELVGLRSVGLAWSNGDFDDTVTLATARNYERIRLPNQPGCEWDPASAVGEYVARMQAAESQDSAANMNGTRMSIPKVFDQSQWLSKDDQNTSLKGGVSPVGCDANGSYLVMSVSTRSKNITSPSVNDFRVLESRVVSVGDDLADTTVARLTNTYGGFKLKDDKRLSNGQIDSKQKLFKKVVTPSRIRKQIVKVYREFDDAGKLKEVDESVSALNVAIDPGNNGRVEVTMPFKVINWLNQIAVEGLEVSQ